MKLLEIYNYIKEEVIKKGFKQEIDWCNKISSLEELDKEYFFREYAWVVINSGMKNKVAESIFKNFWNNGKFNFESVNHPNKNKALRNVFGRLETYFHHFKNSKNKLKYLESLPHIGPITKYHLARNLGLDYAKPDRHLVRIASLFNYDDVQKLCNYLSNLSKDKIGVVDLILWRFATLHENYIQIITKKLKDREGK